MRGPVAGRRYILLALSVPLFAALLAEETRFGYGLGRSRTVCEALGGKFGSAVSRCITPACYLFADCGVWAHPARWRDRLVLGDPVSKAVFWLGEPLRQTQDGIYSWSRGKGSDRVFSASIRDGHLVALDRD